MSDFNRNIGAAPFGGSVSRAEAAAIDAGLRAYMLHVYNYMVLGLAITGLAALGIYLLAVTAYLMARVRFEADRNSRSGSVLYGCALLSTLLAVRTKEITFTIPAVLAAFEQLAMQGSVFGRRRFVLVVPFAVLAMLIPLAIFGPELGLIPGGEGIAEVTPQDKNTLLLGKESITTRGNTGNELLLSVSVPANMPRSLTHGRCVE